MSFEKILIPTDGSKASFEGAEKGLELAEDIGADIVALSVVEEALVEDKIYGSPPAEPERVRKLAQNAVDDLAERAEERGLTVETAVREGEPSKEIVEQVADSDADLIVIGTHGRGGFERALLGSVADKVVRTSHVPVLTVNPGSSEE